jgi:transposase/transposase IS116/IS110/IS902 family protein
MSPLETIQPTPATAQPPAFAAHIGLDWADKKHFWTMLVDGHKTRGELDNTPEAIEVWAAELAQRFGGRPVALALEQSRGAVIAVLSKYAHLVLFPVHPTSLANYRTSFSPSGAKSDAVDGDLTLDYLVKHPEQLRCLRPDTVETRGLQFLTEERRKLVEAHTATLQRLIHWLKQVFPQMLRWFDDPGAPLVADLLLRWPTLQELQKAKPKTLLRFFHQHNCRSEERTQERLQQIRQAVPATDDPALLQAGILSIQNAIRILAGMRQGIADFDRRIAVLYQAHPDRFITKSLPGAGPALEPRLIAAAGSLRDRFESAYNMQCCFGIAPVTERSGNSVWIHWRWACSKFIRQTFHEWAACSIRTCSWARQFYDKQRANQKKHHAAVRALAYKWIRIFFRCWRDRVAYSDQRYEEALCKRAAHPKPIPNDSKVAFSVEWKSCGGFSKPAKVSS